MAGKKTEDNQQFEEYCPSCGNTHCKVCKAPIEKGFLSTYQKLALLVSVPLAMWGAIGTCLSVFNPSWLNLIPYYLLFTTWDVFLRSSMTVGTIIAAAGLTYARGIVNFASRPTGTSLRRPRPVQIAAIFSIAAVAISALYISSIPLGATAIKITSPSNNQVVSAQISVEGTSQNLPSRHMIWILVHPQTSDRYYPQDKTNEQNVTDVRATGYWSTTVYPGLSTETGRFDIIAVLADEQAQGAFNSYLEASARQNSWNGMTRAELPTGIVIYDSITVIRS